MARVAIHLPSMLAQATGGARRVDVEAETLRGALEAAFRACPALRVHVLDETGGLRQHVLCFHNDENSRWRGSLDVPVRDGDRVTLLQAVSGG